MLETHDKLYKDYSSTIQMSYNTSKLLKIWIDFWIIITILDYHKPTFTIGSEKCFLVKISFIMLFPFESALVRGNCNIWKTGGDQKFRVVTCKLLLFYMIEFICLLWQLGIVSCFLFLVLVSNM